MSMTFVFVSNYFNHHQKPFCDAMYAALGEGFTFLATEEMTEERKAMGWGEALPGYVKRVGDFGHSDSGFSETGKGFQKQRSEIDKDLGSGEYKCGNTEHGDDDPENYVNLIIGADMVLFGDAPEYLITPRLLANRPTLRVSESIYKEGQWKFITPRGLHRKYLDHIRFRRNKLWLLCAGGYVASDFSLIHAYPGKMLKWGYFPETKQYDIEALMAKKPLQSRGSDPKAPAARQSDQIAGSQEAEAQKQRDTSEQAAASRPAARLPKILWVGRMIDWKHPEWALEIAKSLTDSSIPYEMELIGEGPMRRGLEEYVRAHRLNVTFTNFLTPGEVRERMEQADIYLLLSDKREGWGAVLNEAMNSGCAVVANARAGAVPFLLEPALRRSAAPGFIFRSGDVAAATAYVKRLLADPALTRQTGLAAYRRIAGLWNAELAAKRLLAVAEAILADAPLPHYEEGPCSVAENISVGKFARRVNHLSD